MSYTATHTCIHLTYHLTMKQLHLFLIALLLIITNTATLRGDVLIQDNKTLIKMSRKGKREFLSPLYLVNGITFNSIREIPVEEIATITVHSPYSEVAAQYGDLSTHGVVEMTLKTIDASPNDSIIGTVNPPEFSESKELFTRACFEKFRSIMLTQIRYPVSALSSKTEGRVLVRFTVDERGLIGDITILESYSKIFDDHIISLLEKAPGWLPYIENGRPQKVEYIFPVQFAFMGSKDADRFPDQPNTIM